MNSRAKVLFFANLREKTGVREAEIEFPLGTTVSEIKKRLLEMYPGLAPNMDTIIVAMNHEFAFDENPVPDGAEIALFPPVSGGEEFPTIIALVDQEIDINQLVEQITSSSTGAACIFSGIVRAVTTRGTPRQTDQLEYEAYRVMAEQKMKQIAEEIRLRWKDVEGIAMVQRTGVLPPGKVSVVIACTSSHRDAGIFEAAHYGIDRLKEIVPIWKKEVSSDKAEWIEGKYIPHRGE